MKYSIRGENGWILDRIKLTFPAWLLVVATAFLTLPCAGQQVTASLSGTVKDTSGAVVPQAQLSITDVSTGVVSKTVSDSAGDYIFLSLPPATYTLEVRHEGFHASVISGITLTVYQKATVDVSLEIGSLAQSVVVQGAAPLVSTTSASIGTVVNEQEISDLPLNLRRTSSLSLLTPGVSNSTGRDLTSANGNGSGFNTTSFSAAGTTSASNLILIDGMLDRALNNGGFALDLAPEMVQEFNMQNNVYDAAYGIAAGAVMNMVSRSGTNQLHGSAWEFLRNGRVLDARNFFAYDQTSPSTGQEIPDSAIPEYIRNQFGFALGGPIRKDKTFAFGSFEGLRLIQGQTRGSTVPTAAMKAGDFSSLLTGQNANLCGVGGPANLSFDTGQMFDPSTEALYTCPSGSQVLVGQPISGNIITNISPFAQKMMAFFPAPNSPGTPNYVNQTPYRENDETVLVRVDHNFSDKDQINGHYIYGKSTEFYPGNFNPFNYEQYYTGQNAVAAWTHTFSPSLLNEVRLGIQRNYMNAGCADCPHPPGTLASFGIVGVSATSPQTEIYPTVYLNNFSGLGDGFYNPDILPDTTEMVEDMLTKIKGRHTMVFGGNFTFYQVLGYEDPVQLNGAATFNGQYSSLAGEVPGVSAASDLADLELGYPSSGAYTKNAFTNELAGGGWFSMFGQDSIRVNSRLSVQAGVRWEYRKLPYDKHDQMATFFPLSYSYTPGDALLVTALPGAANDALCSQAYFVSASGQCLVMTSAQRSQYGLTGGKRREVSLGGGWHSFAPRLGVTLRPTNSDKFIIHTGAGVFYDLPEMNQVVALAARGKSQPDADPAVGVSLPAQVR